MARVLHTFRARLDLIELWQYIGRRNPAAADRIYRRLGARIGILETFPEAGPSRPEIAPDARILVEAPYLILYRIVGEDVQIVRVLHGARRVDPAVFAGGLQ